MNLPNTLKLDDSKVMERAVIDGYAIDRDSFEEELENLNHGLLYRSVKERIRLVF